MLYLNAHLQAFTETDVEWLLERQPAWRREQACRFRHLEGRRQSALAYEELCRGLREEYGIEEAPAFEYNEHGKPSIVGHPEIYFNLSHCKEAAICVISDKPVGVDVESIREFKDSLVNYTMNDEEKAEMASSSNPASTFIRLWTMKEATSKLIGTGITNDVKSLIDTTKYKYNTTEKESYIYTICSFSNGLQD